MPSGSGSLGHDAAGGPRPAGAGHRGPSGGACPGSGMDRPGRRRAKGADTAGVTDQAQARRRAHVGAQQEARRGQRTSGLSHRQVGRPPRGAVNTAGQAAGTASRRLFSGRSAGQRPAGAGHRRSGGPGLPGSGDLCRVTCSRIGQAASVQDTAGQAAGSSAGGRSGTDQRTGGPRGARQRRSGGPAGTASIGSGGPPRNSRRRARRPSRPESPTHIIERHAGRRAELMSWAWTLPGACSGPGRSPSGRDECREPVGSLAETTPLQGER